MRKVTTSDMARAIVQCRRKEIMDYARERVQFLDYSFTRFQTDMAKADLLVDPATVRAKWKIMVSTGFIDETAPGKGFLSVTKISPYLHGYAEAREREIERERYVNAVKEGAQ